MSRGSLLPLAFAVAALAPLAALGANILPASTTGSSQTPITPDTLKPATCATLENRLSPGASTFLGDPVKP